MARASAGAAPQDIETLVSGNTAFALDLLQSLAGPEGSSSADNLVISPYSISIALAMTYAGARGVTAEEMAEVLHLALPSDRLHATFNALDQTIAARSRDFPARNEDEEDTRVELNVVNQLWAQQGYGFLPEFLDLLAADYGAGLRLVDFTKDYEVARLAINDWVAEATKDRIKDLLPAGSLNELTRLVLTNAVYLKAPWDIPFEESLTTDDAFRLPDGSTITVPFMRQSETLGYAEAEAWQAVELPYKGNELSMVIMLPDDLDLGALIGRLDATSLEQMLATLAPETVNMSLPKFEARSELSLGDALRALGMQIPFTDDADFSGMTGDRDLAVDSVIHNGFVSVDEEGTEAAAATAVVMRATSAPTDVKEFRADRPFIWMIRDVETGTVLFLGQVVDPSAGA
jgi:serpin B